MAAYHKNKSITCGILAIFVCIMYLNVSYLYIQSHDFGTRAILCNFSLKEWQLAERLNSQSGYSLGKSDESNGSQLGRTSYVNSSIYEITPGNLMKLPKLDFLPNMKNPCFYVHNPPMNDSGVWVDNDTVLKCWPYFQLIGVEKCGTSDLYEKLHLHHHLFKMINPKNGKVVKEPLWYNGYIRPEPHNHTLGGYLALMDNATRSIYKRCYEQSSLNNGSQCPYMVGDFSARTMSHNYYWFKDEANKHFYFPKYLTADKVHHVFPHTKLLVMLRNPTERIFSDYKFYRGTIYKHRVSPNDFNTRIVMAINTWNQCTFSMRVDVEKCAEGYNWTFANRSNTGVYWGYRSPDRIRVGLYSIFLKRWLQLFPRDNIHVIKMEEYSISPLDYIEKHILPFLGLEPFLPETRTAIEETNMKQFNENIKINLTMSNSTRAILDNFYAPYNLQLSEMLNNDKFLWND